MRFVELVGSYPMIETLTQFRVRHNAIRAHDASHVESLGRRLECYTYLCCLLAYCGKRNVLVTKQGEVGMYLVAYHDDSMLMANL